MFLGGCSESGAARAPVPLSGITHDAFLLVLQFIYTGQHARGHRRDAGPDRSASHACSDAHIQTGATSLTASKAQAALEAASYMQLPDMVEAVVAFFVPKIALVRLLCRQRNARSWPHATSAGRP